MLHFFQHPDNNDSFMCVRYVTRYLRHYNRHCGSHTDQVFLLQVMVTVLDKNDSPPSFGDSPLHYTVSEDMLAGRRIAILKATDPDTPGTLTYSIVGGDDNKFTLDAATGHLSLQDTLDRETKSQYDLTVRADDGVQHTDTTVFIEVRRRCLSFSLPQPPLAAVAPWVVGTHTFSPPSLLLSLAVLFLHLAFLELCP